MKILRLIILLSLCFNIACTPVFATGSAISNDLQLRSVNVSNERITSQDANGLKAIMLDLIGDYETVITDYTYSNTQGYTQHSITVERDWSWILTCVLFIVVVFCTFLSIAKILARF